MLAPLAALLRLHEINCDPAAAAAKGREEARLLQYITDDLQQRYDQLRTRYGVTALTTLERGICMGCYMRQPTILLDVEEDIHECSNCGRLLYDLDVAFELQVG